MAGEVVPQPVDPRLEPIPPPQTEPRIDGLQLGQNLRCSRRGLADFLVRPRAGGLLLFWASATGGAGERLEPLDRFLETAFFFEAERSAQCIVGSLRGDREIRREFSDDDEQDEGALPQDSLHPPGSDPGLHASHRGRDSNPPRR